MDKRIIVLVVIILILSAGLGYEIFTQQNHVNPIANNTTTKNTTKINETVKNTTLEETESQTTDSESGEYGYCAICGKALSYSEANSEFTQGKVCSSCAQNPYYQTDDGAEYANQKLEEAYPDEYSWMNDDSEDDKNH